MNKLIHVKSSSANNIHSDNCLHQENLLYLSERQHNEVLVLLSCIVDSGMGSEVCLSVSST